MWLFLCSLLQATIWTDEGMVKRIRGEAFTTRVSPQLGNDMIYAARGIFNRLLPDVYIASDYRKRSEAGKYVICFFLFQNLFS